MSTRKINHSESFFSRLLLLQGSMTSSEFCREVGISTPLYQKWKHGSVPGHDKLRLITARFGKSPEWLLGVSPAPPEEHIKSCVSDSTEVYMPECQECKKKDIQIERLERIIDKLTK